MAIEGVQTLWSYTAGASLANAQYTFVKLNGTGDQVIQCSAVTDIPVGVLQDNPASGETATVCIFGLTKLVTGAAASSGLAAGQQIGTDAAGAALAITPGTDTTKYLVGRVLYASAAAAEYVSAFIDCVAPGRAA